MDTNSCAPFPLGDPLVGDWGDESDDSPIETFLAASMKLSSINWLVRGAVDGSVQHHCMVPEPKFGL